MDCFFCKFRFDATLRDAAGSVKATTHKGPGYCFVLPRFRSFCFHGQVTGLLNCLYLNFFSNDISIFRLLVILIKNFSENS